MVEFQLAGLGIAVLTGVIRSGAGAVENALDDGKITAFEWRKMGATVIRVGLVTTALFYGVNELFGQDINVLGASAGAFFIDWIILKLRSKRK